MLRVKGEYWGGRWKENGKSLAVPLQRMGDGINQRNSAFSESVDGSFEVGDHVFTKLPICPVM